MATLPSDTVDESSDGISALPHVLRLGMWSAWLLVALDIAYFAAIVAMGAFSGHARDPYWAIADILTIVGATVQVTLFAVIHESSPRGAKVYTLTALGWMLITAALTGTVHFVELIVARRVDFAAQPELRTIFDFWNPSLHKPSLLLGVEFAAWHLFFALSLLFAAVAFRGRGLHAAVRGGLRAAGALCLVGLIGPALSNEGLRFIGVAGYGLIFPVVCALMGFVFREARSSVPAPSGVTPVTPPRET